MEFLRFRAQYKHTEGTGAVERVADEFFLQGTFILGAHPRSASMRTGARITVAVVLLTLSCRPARIAGGRRPPLRVLATLPISGPSPAPLWATSGRSHVATRPGQNPHDLEIRPSQVLLVRRAEILVRNGLEEDAWIDPIVETAATRACCAARRA